MAFRFKELFITSVGAGVADLGLLLVAVTDGVSDDIFIEKV